MLSDDNLFFQGREYCPYPVWCALKEEFQWSFMELSKFGWVFHWMRLSAIKSSHSWIEGTPIDHDRGINICDSQSIREIRTTKEGISRSFYFDEIIMKIRRWKEKLSIMMVGPISRDQYVWCLLSIKILNLTNNSIFWKFSSLGI